MVTAWWKAALFLASTICLVNAQSDMENGTESGSSSGEGSGGEIIIIINFITNKSVMYT